MEEVISVTLVERKITAPHIDVSYPEISALKESIIAQVRINELIRSVVYNLVHAQLTETETPLSITGKYQIMLNKNGILSILFIHHSCSHDRNEEQTGLKSVTFDVKSSRVIELEDLFQEDTDYRSKIRDIIKNQLKDRISNTIDSIYYMDNINEFYMTEESVIIYCQIHRNAPYPSGTLEFTINYTDITDIADTEGVVFRFLDIQ